MNVLLCDLGATNARFELRGGVTEAGGVEAGDVVRRVKDDGDVDEGDEGDATGADDNDADNVPTLPGEPVPPRA